MFKYSRPKVISSNNMFAVATTFENSTSGAKLTTTVTTASTTANHKAEQGLVNIFLSYFDRSLTWTHS